MNKPIKGVTWFPGKRIEVGEIVYYLIQRDGVPTRLKREKALGLIQLMKENPVIVEVYDIEKRFVRRWVKACPWCGARPVQYEMDCDGWASTGSCGTQQCRDGLDYRQALETEEW